MNGRSNTSNSRTPSGPNFASEGASIWTEPSCSASISSPSLNSELFGYTSTLTRPLVRSSASCLNRSAPLPFGVSMATTWLNLMTIGCCALALVGASSVVTASGMANSTANIGLITSSRLRAIGCRLARSRVRRHSNPTRRSAELALEDRVDLRRVGLALRRGHHLADQRVERFFLAGLVLGDDSRARRDRVVDDLLDRAFVADLTQAPGRAECVPVG